jgi:hypothetical protein
MQGSLQNCAFQDGASLSVREQSGQYLYAVAQLKHLRSFIAIGITSFGL